MHCSVKCGRGFREQCNTERGLRSAGQGKSRRGSVRNMRKSKYCGAENGCKNGCGAKSATPYVADRDFFVHIISRDFMNLVVPAVFRS